MKLKYISHDKWEVIYQYLGLNLVGIRYDSDTFSFSFPEFERTNKINLNSNRIKIMDEYKINRFGESLKKHLRGEARDELEKELDRLLSKEINQQILIEMLFEETIVIGVN